MSSPSLGISSHEAFSISFSTKFVKCATVTALGIVTIGAVFAAVEAISTLAIIFFSAIAFLACAASFASISASLNDKSVTVAGFVATFMDDLGPAIAFVFQMGAQIAVQALCQRGADHIRGPMRVQHSFF